MDRPTKLLANAGEEAFEESYKVDGKKFSITVQPGEHAVVPVSDDELKAIEEKLKNAEAHLLADLRRERDAYLKATDWSQLPDVPAEIRKKYAAYRQELRDLPAKADLVNPVFPELPA